MANTTDQTARMREAAESARLWAEAESKRQTAEREDTSAAWLACAIARAAATQHDERQPDPRLRCVLCGLASTDVRPGDDPDLAPEDQLLCAGCRGELPTPTTDQTAQPHACPQPQPNLPCLCPCHGAGAAEARMSCAVHAEIAAGKRTCVEPTCSAPAVAMGESERGWLAPQCAAHLRPVRSTDPAALEAYAQSIEAAEADPQTEAEGDTRTESEACASSAGHAAPTDDAGRETPPHLSPRARAALDLLRAADDAAQERPLGDPATATERIERALSELLDDRAEAELVAQLWGQDFA